MPAPHDDLSHAQRYRARLIASKLETLRLIRALAHADVSPAKMRPRLEQSLTRLAKHDAVVTGRRPMVRRRTCVATALPSRVRPAGDFPGREARTFAHSLGAGLQPGLVDRRPPAASATAPRSAPLAG